MTAVFLLVCGCGVTTQARPERLALSETPSASHPTDVDSGALQVQVYFVRGTRLEAASRSLTTADVPHRLGVLVAGPERREVLSGLRTAIAPQTDLAVTWYPDETLQVDLPRDLTGLTGGNQLLAFAQLVWTLTEIPEVRGIRFSAAGAPVEVPTDSGLAAEPVDREDYVSVSPLPGVRPSGTD